MITKRSCESTILSNMVNLIMGKKSRKDINKNWEAQLKKTFDPENEEKPANFQDEKDISYDLKNIGFIEGKLITKKKGVGSKSEGVVYYILPIDQYSGRWDEILVRKKTHLWQNDLQLHPFVGKVVKIKGDIIETRSSITVDCVEISVKK